MISRGMARRAQWTYVRAHVGWLALDAVIVFLPAAVGALFVPSAFGQGLLIGGGVVAAAAVVAFWVVEVTGTSGMMMGDLAEQWTADELRKLRRSGWKTVNHVALTVRDVDHVLVGPDGTFAVETKWSAQEWALGGERVRAACRQAATGARRLSTWHDFKWRDRRARPARSPLARLPGIGRPHRRPGTGGLVSS